MKGYSGGGGLCAPCGWRGEAKALSGKLTRIAGALRSHGITFTRGKSGDRTITLGRVVEEKDDVDVEDDDLPQFPTSTFKEKGREEIGEVREIASVSSTWSSPDDPWFPF